MLGFTRSFKELKSFELRILHFLNTKRIIGFDNIPINEKDKFLVEAREIISIFCFTNWEYNFINEVVFLSKTIVFSGRFKGSCKNDLIGSDPMERRMMLAKDVLYNNFKS